MHSNRLFSKTLETAEKEKNAASSALPPSNIAYPADVTASDIAKSCFVSANKNIIHALADYIPCKPTDDLAKLSEAYTRPTQKPEIRVITCYSRRRVSMWDIMRSPDLHRKIVEEGLLRGALDVFSDTYNTIDEARNFTGGLASRGSNSPHLVFITSPISFEQKQIGNRSVTVALPFEVYAYQALNADMGYDFALLDTPLKTHSQRDITEVTVLAPGRLIPVDPPAPSAAPESAGSVAKLNR